MRRVIPLAVLVVLSLAGCVPNPVGRVADAGIYADKAERTLAEARSSVAGTALAVDAELTGRSFRAYTNQVVDDAVATLQSAQDTFESIVPPDERSAALRAQVLDTVAAARRALVDVRAALSGEDAELRAAAGALAPLGEQLAGLEEELGG